MERQAHFLDKILENRVIPTSGLTSEIDDEFLRKLASITDYMEKKPNLFGDEATTASYYIAFANQLRKLSDHNIRSKVFANVLEFNVLDGFEDNDLYNRNGQTIGQRKMEIDKFGKWFHNHVLPRRYPEILTDPSKHPDLSLQFFSRMRADGELAAVRWLMQQ